MAFGPTEFGSTCEFEVFMCEWVRYWPKAEPRLGEMVIQFGGACWVRTNDHRIKSPISPIYLHSVQLTASVNFLYINDFIVVCNYIKL